MSDFLDIIYKKRDGGELTAQEIKSFVQNYTNDKIKDYQAASLLMAIYFQGMSNDETFALTNSMLHSGDILDLSEIKGIKIDKHSSGGVGDKTTLICGPIAAACGVRVPKMSGRGLGFTGGTIDKYEAIPGFRTDMTLDTFISQVNRIGLASISQTQNIAPADKKIYALRDVTATVENLSLIAASIMSKKLASGADSILLDIKCGNGAFMQTPADAEKLAEIMCEIGKNAGKKTVAVISDMNQPLGHAIGNSLECIEAIEVLKNNGPTDITMISIYLAALMIYMGGITDNIDEAESMAENALKSGIALEKLRELIIAQGGNAEIIKNYKLFKQPKFCADITARDCNIESGYLKSFQTSKIGMIAQRLGAGRTKKDEDIDHSAGIILYKKIGDYVSADDVFMRLYSDSEKKIDALRPEIMGIIEISKFQTAAPPLIKKIINI